MDFYCDVSALGNEYQAYSDTPTWGSQSTDKPLPQDGNGKAGPGHSASVAIAVIDCTSASASGAGQIFVMGQSVSSTLTGSGSTLATAIKDAINACATATTATYSALLLPVNRLVYARIDPADTKKVQIATRIAGTDWASLPPTYAGTWGTAPSITGFTGGANGPFAYIATGSTVFGKTQLTYGTWFGVSAGVANPGIGDVIHYRTKRSGGNLSATCSFTGPIDVYWGARNHLYDDGTVWSNDNGTLSVTMAQTATGTYKSFKGSMSSANGVSHVSRDYRNLDIYLKYAGSGDGSGFHLFYCYNSGTVNTSVTLVRVGLLEEASNTYSAINILCLGGTYLAGIRMFMLDCYVFCRSSRRIYLVYAVTSNLSKDRFVFNGTRYIVESATGTLAAPIQTYVDQVSIDWIGGEYVDTNGVYSCTEPVICTTSANASRIYIAGVRGVTDMSLALTGWESEYTWDAPEGAVRGFRYGNCWFTVDWKNDGTFPHCGAQNLQGDYWSHRITWTSAPTFNKPVLPLKQSLFYRDTAAMKTLKLELYIPDATPVYLEELGYAITYTDSTGAVRNESLAGTHLIGLNLGGSGTALPSSVTVWSNAISGYSAKKLEITTQYAVKQNSEILIRFMLAATRSPTIVFYVSPLVVVS